MLTNNYAAEIESRQMHNTYVAESNAYRLMRQEARQGQSSALIHQRRARQSQSKARQSLHMAARIRDNGGYRLVERLGARLIAIGRALCERRGADVLQPPGVCVDH